MITQSTILTQIAAVTLAYLTNSILGNVTNKDTISGTNQVTISIIASGNVKLANGSPASALTNGQLFIVQDELGWGHQFVNQPYITTNLAWSGFVGNSLANHLQTNLVGYSNSLGAASEAMFSTQDFVNTNLVPNVNFWLKVAPEKTGIVVANGTPPTGGIGGSAVTPRHVLNCRHAPFQAGRSLFFVDDNGALVSRTVVESVTFGNGDIQVMILNANLPVTVHPFKVMQTNYLNQLPNAASGRLELLGMNQFNLIFPKVGGFRIDIPVVYTYSDLTWGWNQTVIGGDSGHPIMALVGTNLVLLSHWWHGDGYSGNGGDGPNYSLDFNTINATMHYLLTNNSVGSDYQLQPADLSAFPSY